MDVAVFWPNLLDRRQLRALIGDGDMHSAFLPRLAPFLQGGVVEFTAAAQDKRHGSLLLGSGPEFVAKGLACALCVHACLFSLIDTKAASHAGHSTSAEAMVFRSLLC